MAKYNMGDFSLHQGDCHPEANKRQQELTDIFGISYVAPEDVIQAPILLKG